MNGSSVMSPTGVKQQAGFAHNESDDRRCFGPLIIEGASELTGSSPLDIELPTR